MELERWEVEKKLMEEDLSESKVRETELELKKEELVKMVGEAEKTLLVLNERIMEPTINGVRDIKDGGGQKCSLEGQLHWPVVGALGLVAAATVFVCYSKRT